MQGFIKETHTQKVYDLLIAPYNATPMIKSNADYVLTGHQDQKIINQAIEKCYEGQGEDWGSANIYISAGNVIVDGPIEYRNFINLDGADQFTSFYIEDAVTAEYPQRDWYLFEPKVENADWCWLLLNGLYVYALTMNGWDSPASLKGMFNIFGWKSINIHNTGLYVNNNAPTIFPICKVNTGAKLDFSGRNADIEGDVVNVGTLIDLSGTPGACSVSLRESYVGWCDTAIKMENNNPDITLRNIESTGMLKIYSGTTTKLKVYNVQFLEKKGIANIAQGATTLVVNHGLPYTPVLSQFTLTPDKNTAIFITNITSTQFTLNIPASVTGGVNIGWKVEY